MGGALTGAAVGLASEKQEPAPAAPAAEKGWEFMGGAGHHSATAAWRAAVAVVRASATEASAARPTPAPLWSSPGASGRLTAVDLLEQRLDEVDRQREHDRRDLVDADLRSVCR